MSSTNVTAISTLNPLAAAMRQAEQDPVYGRVYRILNTNRLGSWGDAIDVYSDIRRNFIWSDLTALVGAKPTKENKERAEAHLTELREKLTGASDMLPKAEAMVRAWAPVQPVKTTKAAKPKTKVVKNAFAALLEEDEEE